MERLIAQGKELVKANHLDEAGVRFTAASQLAQRRGDRAREARALRGLSGCKLRQFDYRAARQAAERSRSLALELGDSTTAGGATVNLASIYLQLDNYAQADREAARAAELLKDSPNKEVLLKALLIFANTEAERIRNKQQPPGTGATLEPPPDDLAQLETNYRRGIAVAGASHLPRSEAQLWEELGYSFLLVHCPERAEEPLHRAFLLETANGDTDALAVNNEHQAELQLQERNYRLALALIDRALASPSASFKSLPRFYPLHVRGLLLARLKREPEALAELKRAVESADSWRQGALPGDISGTLVVVELHDVYNDYAQMAAAVGLKTHDGHLVREGLAVLAENRAANLREEIKRAYSERQRLPPRYFDLLKELQAAQAHVSLGDDGPEDKLKLQQVRLEIGGIENELGLKRADFSQSTERSDYENSLNQIQARLSAQEALLSFSLGKEQSFLWTVTRDSVRVCRLASENLIGALARRFSQAVQRRQPADGAGPQLSRELFGGLPPDIWGRREWLIASDGVLWGGIPFSDLPELSGAGGKPLANSRNIRFIPSELLLLSADKVRARRLFVGVGDPIYNVADSRNQAPRARKAGSGSVSVRAQRASTALSRLVGSNREVQAAARESGLPDAETLTGAQATVAGVERAIARKPEILHFAVHVVSPSTRTGETPLNAPQAALALSLTHDQVPELLTPEAIATLRLPGSLVILSGCSSQRGDILPGAGLMGLSRAWLLAGASAVVVSAWPTPDDSGRFFSSFYKHFDAIPSGTLAERAAAALGQTQVEMEYGGGYRSAPNFWAAYSIISKE